ncbi:MAG: response regulator [Leptolyngbyaceae cyanobacterium]
MPNPENVPKAPAPTADSVGDFEDPMEAQLQQELRSMFDVDTQKGLQTYLDQSGRLQSETWSNDIQTLYRVIHTIKGGAVTVGADAILHVSTVLEDLLSDLRHLETAPPLEDGQLREVLVEAGELLAATLPIEAKGEAARAQVDPSVQRIQVLRSQIQERYLPQWSQQKQIQQEFAQQGLDLVVLDLEIALENLPSGAALSESLLHTARNSIDQLYQIGQDLQLSSGWGQLLLQAETLMGELSETVWRTQWPRLIQALKACARASGEAVSFTLNLAASEPVPVPLFPGEPGTASTAVRPTTDPTDAADDTADMTDVFPDMDTFLDELGSLEAPLDPDDSDVAATDSDPPSAIAGVTTPPAAEPAAIDDPETLAAIDRAISEATQDVTPTDTDTEAAVSDTASMAIEDSAGLNWGTSESTPEQEADEAPNADTVQSHSTSLPAQTDSPSVSPSASEEAPALNGAGAQRNGTAAPESGQEHSDIFLVEDPAAGVPPQVEDLDALAALDPEMAADTQNQLPVSEAATSDTWLINLLAEALDTDAETDAETAAALSNTSVSSLSATAEATETTEQIQIPVPLERLDRSAQDLVNALLAVRSTQGIYDVLQSQILQLASLAKEGVQHITRLRQIQDDYALVDNLRLNARQTGPTPERYRQGYVTINRLLETSLRLSELGAETEKSAKQMTESLQFLDRNILRLQATVEESRLVPFRNLAFRARAILRDLITRFQKPAKLVIQGEHTELDVGSARSLEPALLHLIRNAFDHALELPQDRQAAGKPEQGTLTLSLQRLGNLYRLSLQDDGRGMNAQAICDRAQTLGLPLSDTSTASNLLAVICQPGFSSETEVSDISGRGVGMDVVAAQVTRLGGKLTVETHPGRGTTFSLQFPVPHLLVPCMLLQAGDRTFAVPTEDVRNAALIESLQAIQVKEKDSAYSWQIEQDNGAIPGLDLLEYWQPQRSGRTLEETAVCAYVHSSGLDRGAWLIADELLGQSDLLINALPTPLQPPEGLLGVSLQPDGTLVPVLNATDIIEWLYTATPESDVAVSGESEADAPVTVSSTPTILIVDDAALMRRRIEASLTSYGHVTHTCGDGLEAWNWLKANPAPALVITDIEMPNMDGFTLIDRCRQENLSMPILVVSSRLSEDWFAEAKRVGADDYLTKGFSTLDLINKVTQLVAAEE